ncbi:HMA domain-containing protein [Psidium guajava]|nr:HMA domain-containing protein [Psidium guajava]
MSLWWTEAQPRGKAVEGDRADLRRLYPRNSPAAIATLKRVRQRRPLVVRSLESAPPVAVISAILGLNDDEEVKASAQPRRCDGCQAKTDTVGRDAGQTDPDQAEVVRGGHRQSLMTVEADLQRAWAGLVEALS